MGTIVSAVIDGILKAALDWLSALQQRRDDKRAGQAQQAAAETAATAKTNAAEAKSETQTDRTSSGLAQAARKGEF